MRRSSPARYSVSTAEKWLEVTVDGGMNAWSIFKNVIATRTEQKRERSFWVFGFRLRRGYGGHIAASFLSMLLTIIFSPTRRFPQYTVEATAAIC
jgi:hypothetical protein